MTNGTKQQPKRHNKQQPKRHNKKKKQDLAMKRLFMDYIWKYRFALLLLEKGEPIKGEELESAQLVLDWIDNLLVLKPELVLYFCNGDEKKFDAVVNEKLDDKVFMWHVVNFDPLLTTEIKEHETSLIFKDKDVANVLTNIQVC